MKNILFPDSCAICGCSFISDTEIQYGFCEKCKANISPVQGQECSICGKPLISEKDICLSCRNGAGHSYDRLWTLFPYTGIFRKLLTAYKFRKKVAIADFFTDKILAAIAANPVLQSAVIVPVPPRPGKIKDNGWDQVDYLVRRIIKNKQSRVKISFCLKRMKSKVQKSLNRTERLENLKGRIYLHGAYSKASTAPETVLIIDDVITTGSTMEVCAFVLKDAGVKNVYGLCLFYD
ncbi:MAG: ComF family protein [Treponema sp.]|nr:ComF family protein [Treponema sp.]